LQHFFFKGGILPDAGRIVRFLEFDGSYSAIIFAGDCSSNSNTQLKRKCPLSKTLKARRKLQATINAEIQETVVEQFRCVRGATSKAIQDVVDVASVEAGKSNSKIRISSLGDDLVLKDLVSEAANHGDRSGMKILRSCDLADKSLLHFPGNMDKIAPILLEAHISLAVDWDFIFEGRGIERVVFVDLDQISLGPDARVPENTLVLCVYGESFPTGNLPLTSQLAQSMLQRTFFLLCTGSGKERTDGVIDMLAVDLYHQKQKRIVCVSNDGGFDSLVFLLHFRGAHVMRVSSTRPISMKELLERAS
jgi:hypothetical protein